MSTALNGESAFIRGGVMSKIERYNWTLLDKPGKFKRIAKTLILVDHAYQRHGVEGQQRILDMAAKWSWIACGTLTVADRGGIFYAMDGQGRKLAADLRSDVDLLPCLVFETKNIAEEARGFLAVNVHRRSILAIEKFNALVAVEDPAALFVERLIKDSGRVVSRALSEHNRVRCVGVMLKCADTDPDALARVWPLIAKLCDGYAISGELVAGTFMAERRAMNDASLSKAPWRNRYIKVGYQEMIDSIARAKAYYARGGGAVYADGIVKAVNKGARSDLLQIPVVQAIQEGDVSMRATIRDPMIEHTGESA